MSELATEPDCWPHPFDIVDINFLYQVDYP